MSPPDPLRGAEHPAAGDPVEAALDALLARAEMGHVLTAAQIEREHAPETAAALVRALSEAGLLGVRQTLPFHRVGPFRILHELGRGATGIVAMVEVESAVFGLDPGARVALKVLHAHLVDDPRVLESFREEARLGTEIQSEHLVDVYGFGTFETTHGPEACVAMALVEGQTLDALCEGGTPLSEVLCRSIGSQVATALQAIHDAGYVHRDVKPANILIDDGGRAWLLDLGFLSPSSSPPTRHAAGTRRYAPPEQLEGREPDDPRNDLYALGRTLAEVATETSDAPEKHLASLSPFLRSALRALTRADREQRPQSARLVAALLADGEASVWWRAQEDSAPSAARGDALTAQVHGRTRERAELETALLRTRRGTGQVHVLLGEAGVGKTRLVQSFIGGRHDAATLAGSFRASASPGAASGLRGAFRSATTVHTSLEALPTEIGKQITAWLEGADQEATRPRALASGLLAVLSDLSAEQPVLLWVDDVHLAPAGDRAILQGLVRGLGDIATCVVMTARETRDAAWLSELASQEHVTVSTLAPLSDIAMARLLHDASRPRRLASVLVDALVERARGVPMQALATFATPDLQEALEQQVDGSWSLRTGGSELPWPRDLLDAQRALISRRPEHEQRALTLGALTGERLDLPAMEAILGDDSPPPADVLASFVPTLLVLDTDTFTWAHDTAWEAARAYGQEQGWSVAHHDALASHYLARGGCAPRPPEATIYHLLEAGRGAEAWPLVQEHVDRLMVAGRFDLAGQLGARALASEERGSIEARLRLLDELTVCARSAGGWADECKLMEARIALLDLTDQHGAQVDERTNLALTLANGGQHSNRCESLLEEATALAERHGLRSARGPILEVRGQLASARGESARCETLWLEAHSYLVAHGDAEQIANSWCRLGMAARRAGRRQEAREHFAKGQEVARAGSCPATAAYALGNIAQLSALGGDMIESTRLFEQCIKELRALGISSWTIFAEKHVALAAARRGEIARALQELNHVLAKALELGNDLVIYSCLEHLGLLHLELGHIRGARRLVERALRRTRAHPLPDGQGRLTFVLALIERRACAPKIAQGLYAAACGVDVESVINRGVRFRLTWAEELSLEGRHTAALEHFRALPPLEPRMGPAQAVKLRLWLAVLDEQEMSPEFLEFATSTGARGSCGLRMRIGYLRWLLGHGKAHLASAQDELLTLVRGAPPRYRISMIENVPLHRHVHHALRPGGTQP